MFDLAWPNGNQKELSQLAVILLNEGSETLVVASQEGLRCFTSTDEFKR